MKDNTARWCEWCDCPHTIIEKKGLGLGMLIIKTGEIMWTTGDLDKTLERSL